MVSRRDIAAEIMRRVDSRNFVGQLTGNAQSGSELARQVVGNGGDNRELQRALNRIEQLESRVASLQSVTRSESGYAARYGDRDRFMGRSIGTSGAPGKGGVVTSQPVEIDGENPDSSYPIVISPTDLEVITGQYVCGVSVFGMDDLDEASQIEMTLQVNNRDTFGGVQKIPLNLMTATIFDPQIIYPINDELPLDVSLTGRLDIADGAEFLESLKLRFQFFTGGTCR